jgi:hypothetical protein
MENIKIKVDNKELVISANDKICNGFYIADDTNTVRNNIKVLGIEFDSVGSEAQSKITKVGDYSFLTTKAEHGYMQHIILPSIDKSGFDAYVQSLRIPQVQELLYTTFRLQRNLI